MEGLLRLPTLELGPKRACGVHAKGRMHARLWLGTHLHQFLLLLDILLLVLYLEYVHLL